MPNRVSLTKIDNALQGLQKSDPRLYEFCQEIKRQFEYIVLEIGQPTQRTEATTETGDVPNVEDFEVLIRTRYIELTWTPIPGHTYDIRLGENFENADRLGITSSSEFFLEADRFPKGSYTFLIKAINFDGETSESPTSTVVELVGISSILNLRVVEFENYFTLSWERPDSEFQIDFYEIQLNDDVIGRVTSNFFVHVSQIAVSGEIHVTPVDIAGNRGQTASTEVSILAPLDFYTLSEIRDEEFGGDKVNAHIESGFGLLVPVDTVETFAEKFEDYSTVGDKVDGFPIWAQPAVLSGSYTKEYDFGQDYENCFINFAHQVNQLWEMQSVNVSLEVGHRADGESDYTDLDLTSRLYLTAVRYVRVAMTFQSQPDFLPVCLLIWLQIDLGLHLSNEAGEETVEQGSGERILFSTDYRAAPVVTATVKTSTAKFAAIESIDSDGFNVKVFDTNGDAANNEIVEWHARGAV